MFISCAWAILFMTIFYLLEINIYVSALRWIYQLEKTRCECSDTYHREYIKKWCHIYIIVSTLAYLYNMYEIFHEDLRVGKTMIAFQIPFTFLSFINVIISIHYIDKLKKMNCKCSEELTRETYYIFNWLKIGLFGFFALILLIITLAVAYFIISNKLSSWKFTFQNAKIEISYENTSRMKPRTPISFSIPKIR